MVKNYMPSSLPEALDILAREQVIPYAGGTDIMVRPKEQAVYLFLSKIPEMSQIIADKDHIRIGAACTFSAVIENGLIPAILKDGARQVGVPAIRNLGTVGGNICNGSPKGDVTLVLTVIDAKLRLISKRGERLIPAPEFILGRNKTVRQQDELLFEILVPKKGLENYYYKKIGGRKALTRARVSFAAILEKADTKNNNEDNRIVACSTAFGAVSDMIIRRRDIDEMLIGKTILEARAAKDAYLAAYEQTIIPAKGRISAEYRKAVCMNLLGDFLDQNGI